jgi:hypothetical protein
MKSISRLLLPRSTTGRLQGHHQVRLERVNAALARWDEAEAAARLPPGLRRPVRRPVLPRSSLEGLRAMLVEELARLERGPEG